MNDGKFREKMEMIIGNRTFDVTNHTYVMGILNVTPDSFSDGGRFHKRDEVLFRVEEMIKEGMDILDIGGESTRPGYTRISDEEEIERIIPVITAIRSRFDVPVSLDTYKSEVAKEGIKAGVDLINDIWGLKYDKNMAGIIAKADMPCCLMHNRNHTDYQCFMEDVAADFSETLRLAAMAGIKDERIILDPGVGFGKTYEQNLEIINRLQELKIFGYPILLGASRKSVIGITLDTPVEERLEGTLATSVIAVLKGCGFVRVHDIKENVRAIRMTEAILKA